MADPTHDSAAMLQPPGPFVPLPVADQMAKAFALLYDVEIPELTPDISEVVDQLNIIVAAISDSGLMLWASPIVYFRTECGFGTYLQDVSAHRVSDWNRFLFDTLDIEATAPWRRPIYRGVPITDYDARPGYAWRFFNHFGIDIYDASGGRGVYGLFNGFFPGKYDINVDDTIDLSVGITATTSFSIAWDHLATGLPKIGFYLLLNGERVPGKEALVDVLDGVHTFTGLTAGTTYDVSGYLMDRYNQSSTASILSVTTLGGGAPTAPTGVTATNPYSRGFTVSWDPVATAISYTVYIDSSTTGTIPYPAIPGTSFDVSGNFEPVSFNSTRLFTVRVSATNAAGEIAKSSEVSVSTTYVPPKPTGLVASNITETGFTLSWDPVTNPNITTFAVMLNGDMVGPLLLPDVFTATYNNIIPGTYSVAVNASNNNAGTGATSDPILVTVGPPLPLQPNAQLTPLRYFASEEDTPIQTTNQLIIIDSADYDSSQLSANYALIDITGLMSISTVKTTSTSFPYVSRELIAICIIPPTSSFYAPGGNNSFHNSFLLTNTVSGGGTNNPTVPFSAVITSSKRTIAYAKFTLDMFSLGYYSSVEYKTGLAPSFETLATLSLTYSYTP